MPPGWQELVLPAPASACPLPFAALHPRDYQSLHPRDIWAASSTCSQEPLGQGKLPLA